MLLLHNLAEADADTAVLLRRQLPQVHLEGLVAALGGLLHCPDTWASKAAALIAVVCLFVFSVPARGMLVCTVWVQKPGRVQARAGYDCVSPHGWRSMQACDVCVPPLLGSLACVLPWCSCHTHMCAALRASHAVRGCPPRDLRRSG